MSKNNRIKQLENKIRQLEQNKPKEEPKQELSLEIKPHDKLPGLGGSFEGMGKSFQDMRDNIPHIKLGGGESKVVNKNYQPDPLVEKLKKWLLIGLTALVGGGALILVVWKIIARFIS